MNDPKIIPLTELIEGRAYEGIGRNFSFAIWDGEHFYGLRYKFGSKFIDQEHYRDGSRTGTFAPTKLLGEP